MVKILDITSGILNGSSYVVSHPQKATLDPREKQYQNLRGREHCQKNSAKLALVLVWDSGMYSGWTWLGMRRDFEQFGQCATTYLCVQQKMWLTLPVRRHTSVEPIFAHPRPPFIQSTGFKPDSAGSTGRGPYSLSQLNGSARRPRPSTPNRVEKCSWVVTWGAFPS